MLNTTKETQYTRGTSSAKRRRISGVPAPVSSIGFESDDDESSENDNGSGDADNGDNDEEE
jgi:hypothetical protein